MFFICRTNEFTDDINDDDEQEKFDFAVLTKEEFGNLSDDEKLKYCYGITKGFENEYTNKTYPDDDPYLLDWIENLLKEEELYEEFFYSYFSENFEEEFKVSISIFESGSDEKWDAAWETWDKVIDDVGLHHYYLWAINKIYNFEKYYLILLKKSEYETGYYEGMYLAREKWRQKNRKRQEGIYNQIIKKNRTIWDDYIREKKIRYSVSFQKEYPGGLSEDEKEAFEIYVELIYWNKELKSASSRKKTFKDYPDINF